MTLNGKSKMAAKFKTDINFLFQKYVMLSPMMLHSKFELNRSIFKKNSREPCLKTRLQTY